MRDVEPHRLARLDQWHATLDELVQLTVRHRDDECPQPPGTWSTCVGVRAGERVDELEPVVARVLLELAIVRLAGQRAFIYEPSFVCWVPNRPGEDPDDHEHDTSLPCEWGWRCDTDGCSFRTDDIPCPDHAPTVVPALRLVECRTEPRSHWLWAHRNEDDGHSCPACHADSLLAELEPLRRNARKHAHRWCWLANRAKKGMIWLRLMRRSGFTNAWGYCPHIDARWRWTR